MDIDKVWEDALYDRNLTRNMEELKINNVVNCCDDSYDIINEGYYVCNNCGQVKEYKIIDQDMYGFSNGENNMYLRTFGSELFPVSSNATYINGYSKIAKLNSWNSMPYNEKVLWDVSNDIKSRFSEILSKKTIMESLTIYKKFYETSDSCRGENKKGFIAVCVYIACTNNLSPLSPKDLAKIMEIDVKKIYQCIQKYSEITNENTAFYKKASDFINPYCIKLNIEFKIQKIITKLTKVVQDIQEVSSSIPQNVCICCIVFCCNEMKTPLDLKKVSEEFNISETSIDKIVKIIQKRKKSIYREIKKA